jgi:hypothetical protein
MRSIVLRTALLVLSLCLAGELGAPVLADAMKKKLGADCKSGGNAACLSGWCDAGMGSANTNTCVPAAGTGGEGDHCTRDAHCKSMKCSKQKCRKPSVTDEIAKCQNCGACFGGPCPRYGCSDKEPCVRCCGKNWKNAEAIVMSLENDVVAAVRGSCKERDLWGKRDKIVACGFKHGLQSQPSVTKALSDKGYKEGTAKYKELLGKFEKFDTIQEEVDKHLKYWNEKNPAAWAELGIKKVGDAVGQAAEWAKKAFCDTIGAPVCLVVDIIVEVVKDPSTFFQRLAKEIERRANEVRKSLEKLKGAFFELVTGKKHIDEITRGIGPFLGKVQKAVEHALNMITVGAPKLVAEITNKIVAGAMALSMTPPTVILAGTLLGMKELAKVVIPALLEGVEKVKGAIDRMPKEAKFIIQGVWEFVKGVFPAAAQVLGFADAPKLKERMRAIIERVLDVSGKIRKGAEKALDLLKRAKSGQASAAQVKEETKKLIPTEISKEEQARIVDEIGAFVGDQIMDFLEEPLRKLVSMAIGKVVQLLDVPRSALISAIGSIPYAGGMLSAALNFAIGLMVEQLTNLISDEFVRQANDLVQTLVKDLGEGVKAALLRKPRSGKQMGMLVSLLKKFADVSGEVTGSLESASKSLSQGLEAAVAK